MADPLRAFDEPSYRLWLEIARDFRQKRRRQVEADPQMAQQGNSIYVAQVPTDEYLPARSGNTPGKLECDIYEMVIDDETTDEALITKISESVPIRELVYNIYDKGIAPCFPFVARRDQFGLFIADNVAFQPYALVDCRGRRPNVYVLNDLAPYLGKVTKWDGACWRITCATTSQSEGSSTSYAYLPLTAFYDDCATCKACYRLAPCSGTGPDRYTNTDLSAHVGKVIRIVDEEMCYTVYVASNCLNATPIGNYDYYETCTPCFECYTLVNCYNPSDTIKVTNDLARIVNRTADQVWEEGWVFAIDGKCYEATAFGSSCSGATKKTISNYYSSCPSCGCFKLTPCTGTGAPIYARGATRGSTDIDFRVLLAGMPDADPPVPATPYVRLNDGECYHVTVSADCATSTDVVIVEVYTTCESCLVYTLTPCSGTGSPITTYTDLEGLGFAEDDIIKRNDGDCFTITNKTAVFAGSVEFTPDTDQPGPYPDCPTCERTNKYKLTPACAAEADCDSSEDEEMDPIVTTTDLHAAVGLYVRYKGMPFSVSTTSDAVTHETIEYEGPFPDCDAATSSPVNATFSVIDETEDRILKLRFKNGLLVSVCPGPSASENC